MQLIPVRDKPKPFSVNRTAIGPMMRSARVQQRRERQKAFESALAKAGRSELRRVQVKVGDSVVQLRGFVTSYFLKQVAQETVRSLATGLRLDNQIRVAPRISPLGPNRQAADASHLRQNVEIQRG